MRIHKQYVCPLGCCVVKGLTRDRAVLFLEINGERIRFDALGARLGVTVSAIKKRYVNQTCMSRTAAELESSKVRKEAKGVTGATVTNTVAAQFLALRWP